MVFRVDEFKQSGLYLLFPGKADHSHPRKIEAFAHVFESNLDQIPAEIRAAAAFQACPVCPEKGRAKFCHALPATLAFFDELKGFKSFDNVGAVYRGRKQDLALVPKTSMQEALQFVAIFSLMYYCEVGKQYWKFFLGIHPLMGPEEMITRIHLNIYWIAKATNRRSTKSCIPSEMRSSAPAGVR